MKEQKTSCSIFTRDMEKVKNFLEHQNLSRKERELVPLSRADVLRICIEYAESHGVFAA